jgi:hypothetical protein
MTVNPMSPINCISSSFSPSRTLLSATPYIPIAIPVFGDRSGTQHSDLTKGSSTTTGISLNLSSSLRSEMKTYVSWGDSQKNEVKTGPGEQPEESRGPAPCHSRSFSSLSCCSDSDCPDSAIMNSFDILDRVMKPRFAFSRRAPSCANAVRIGSSEDRGEFSLAASGEAIEGSSG